jgi:aminocarboxymuconate-semialdehyde decarboxylase
MASASAPETREPGTTVRVDVHSHVMPLESQRSAGNLGPFLSASKDGITLRFGDLARVGAERNHHSGLSPHAARTAGEGGRTDLDGQAALRRFSDPTVRLKEMDENNIDAMVVTVSPLLYGYFLTGSTAGQHAHVQNSALAQYCDGNRARLFFSATLPVQNVPAAVRELEFAVEILGAKAINLGAGLDGRSFADRELDPIWARCADYQVPVFIHPSPIDGDQAVGLQAILGHTYQQTVAFATLLLGGVLDRYPTLKFLLTHGGGYLPYQFGRVERMAKGYGHCTSKGPLRDYLPNFYFDTLVQDAKARRFLIDWAGADHVLVGDEYGQEPDDGFQFVAELNLPLADVTLITGANATKLFRLDAP